MLIMRKMMTFLSNVVPAAREYALNWLSNPEIEEATARVLNRAWNGKKAASK
jgi:hypothetical protein